MTIRFGYQIGSTIGSDTEYKGSRPFLENEKKERKGKRREENFFVFSVRQAAARAQNTKRNEAERERDREREREREREKEKEREREREAVRSSKEASKIDRSRRRWSEGGRGEVQEHKKKKKK